MSVSLTFPSAGEEAISRMRPDYNVRDNNCQKFALDLLDLILEGPRERFVSSYSTSASMASPDLPLPKPVLVFASEEEAEQWKAKEVAEEAAAKQAKEVAAAVKAEAAVNEGVTIQSVEVHGEVTVTGEVAAKEPHEELVENVKKMMEDETPRL